MLESDFFCEVSEISDALFKRIYKKSYKEDSTIPIDCLRYIKLSHYGFDGSVHIGELIVNASITEKVTCIFRELYSIKYPIEKLRLVDEYDADDLLSMADNNSSSFNYRTIEGTSRLSKHSKGMAIDINPLYNPYVRNINGRKSILPENAIPYADRSCDCPYYIHKNDNCYCIFIKYGFTWGGEWKDSKDYQHFEID